MLRIHFLEDPPGGGIWPHLPFLYYERNYWPGQGERRSCSSALSPMLLEEEDNVAYLRYP